MDPRGDLLTSGIMEPRGLGLWYSELMDPRGLRSWSMLGAMLPLGDLKAPLSIISGQIDPRGLLSWSIGVLAFPLSDLGTSGQIDPRGVLSNSMLAMLPLGLRDVLSGSSECLELLIPPLSGIRLFRAWDKAAADPGTMLPLGLRL